METRTTTTMEQEVWYIFTDMDNTLIGQPHSELLDPKKSILRLLFKIKEGPYKENLERVNVTDMEVWRCSSLSLDGLDPDEIGELVGNLKLSTDEDSDGKKLAHWGLVGDLHLGDREPLIVRVKTIHKRERADESDYDYREGAKMSKLACIESSKANDASFYEDLQRSQQERILDDCPEPDNDIPPLPLLYSGFGAFRDTVDDPTANLGSDLMDNVDLLANAMCRLGYEKRKQDIEQGHLRKIFTDYFFGEPKEFSYAVENGSKATTDGYLLACHNGPLFIVEYKRQIAAAEPQLASYFLRLALKPAEDIFRQWRQPALGLLIRGTYISFHGLVMVDEQVRILPLTHVFPCNDSELHNRRPLYLAFEAACRLLACIRRDAASLVESPSPAILGSCRRLPNINGLFRVIGGKTQARERVRFQIIERFATDLGGKRYLYRASTTDPNSQDILVKFSRQYGVDVHMFCASIQHAPELLAFERLPGGWIGIAMELLSAKRILESEKLVVHGEKWRNDMDKIVEVIHTKGYVHGDLRPPNFIVDGDKLVLVDFDFGGKEMEVTFPDASLHPILRETRLETHPTRGRDKLVLEDTKAQITSHGGAIFSHFDLGTSTQAL